MDEGYKNRSIGSTLMNATSSRAHTIITIEFKQISFEDGRKNEKFSVINLVDLAGSEKAGQTGCHPQGAHTHGKEVATWNRTYNLKIYR